MEARVRCILGVEWRFLKVAKDGEGRLALKGFSFSMDARVSMMSTTAAANGKRNRKLDRWAWGLSVLDGRRGLSEGMKMNRSQLAGASTKRRAGATQASSLTRNLSQKIPTLGRTRAAERVRGGCGVGLRIRRKMSEP
jgi:hypothetical protein